MPTENNRQQIESNDSDGKKNKSYNTGKKPVNMQRQALGTTIRKGRAPQSINHLLNRGVCLIIIIIIIIMVSFFGVCIQRNRDLNLQF